MSGKYIEKFFVTWRKCIRRLLLLPYQTHSRYLPCIVNDLPVEIQIHIRSLKLFSSFLNSENNMLQICSRLVINGSNSVMCENLNQMLFVAIKV